MEKKSENKIILSSGATTLGHFSLIFRQEPDETSHSIVPNKSMGFRIGIVTKGSSSWPEKSY
jgi:hypothetical protein